MHKKLAKINYYISPLSVAINVRHTNDSKDVDVDVNVDSDGEE